MLGKNEEPKWTKKNIERKSGSTTFKQCGWCKYAIGACRYGCTFEGRCQLFPSYHGDRKINWNTLCKIKKYGKDDLKDFIGSHEYEIKDAKNNIEMEKRYIQILKKLKKKAVAKPSLPDARSVEHFKVGSRVAVFYIGHWSFATVVYGYRTYDGMVSYHIDKTPKPNYEYLDPTDNSKYAKKLVKNIGKLANSPRCGVSVPTVILKSEYDYFVKHQKDWEVWRDITCSKRYNGETISILISPQMDYENKKLHKEVI